MVRMTPAAARAERSLDIDALLADPAKRIIVCCGAGGVGKTTTAAALGVRAAEAGRRVVVLTIDPALRLAQSLGLNALDNTPRPVAGIDTRAGGSMDAMMLDMKRTFDEVVEQHASPEKAASILANPFYVAVSSSFAGTQEYMAMEKLGQLRQQSLQENGWDLIIVDTPPSRSALDFLDAPKRLGSFLDGRFIRLLMAPAKAGGKAYLKAASATLSLAVGVMTKVLGGELLRDVQTFVAALDTMFGGFRERADQTYALLQAPETAFVVVASPDRDALREAAFFVERERPGGDGRDAFQRQCGPLAAPCRPGHERHPASGADQSLPGVQPRGRHHPGAGRRPRHPRPGWAASSRGGSGGLMPAGPTGLWAQVRSARPCAPPAIAASKGPPATRSRRGAAGARRAVRAR